MLTSCSLAFSLVIAWGEQWEWRFIRPLRFFDSLLFEAPADWKARSARGRRPLLAAGWPAWLKSQGEINFFSLSALLSGSIATGP